MDFYINEIIIVGNLGHDPELRYFPDGTAYLRLSIATTDSWLDKNTGEYIDDTEWHLALVRGKQAEFVASKMAKGNKIWLRGKVKTRGYTDNDGVSKSITEIHVKELKPVNLKPRIEEHTTTESNNPLENYQ